MGDDNSLISNIKNKVGRLIELNNTLKQENTVLTNKQEELNKIIEKQNYLIEELKEKNRNLIISKSVKHLEGESDVKNKIDKLVREIDKCIGLLND